jgi:hypothetical protein
MSASLVSTTVIAGYLSFWATGTECIIASTQVGPVITYPIIDGASAARSSTA